MPQMRNRGKGVGVPKMPAFSCPLFALAWPSRVIRPPPQFARRAGTPSAVRSLVVRSLSAHADIARPANTELGAVSGRLDLRGGPGRSPRYHRKPTVPALIGVGMGPKMIDKLSSVLCWVCGKPVPLSECKNDDCQHPVHEDCYAAETLTEQPKPHKPSPE